MKLALAGVILTEARFVVTSKKEMVKHVIKVLLLLESKEGFWVVHAV